MLNVNLENVEAQGSFECVPAGDYVLNVEDAEVRETKAGTGEYISVQFNIIKGEYEGRKIFTMFNIKNPNQKAVDIGLSQLKSLLLAANASSFQLKSVAELLGLTIKAKVAIKSSTEYGDQNVVKSYSAYTDTSGANFDSSEIPF